MDDIDEVDEDDNEDDNDDDDLIDVSDSKSIQLLDENQVNDDAVSVARALHRMVDRQA